MNKLCKLMVIIITLTTPNILSASLLSDNLIGYWKLDNNGLDSSGSGSHLDIITAPYDTGLTGSGLHTNGTDAGGHARRLVDDNIYDFDTGDFTIQTWVKFDSLTNTQVLFNKEGSPITGLGWSIEKLNNNSFRFTAGGSNGAMFLHSNIRPISTTVFHHLVVTRKNNLFNMYYDKNIIATQTWTEDISSSGQIYIGGKQGSELATNGTLDELAIWNRALSETEANQLYSDQSISTNAVPEPSTYILFLFGCCSFFYWKKKIIVS